MPNLVPPVSDVAAARAYRERITAALPAGVEFTPLMTCYLTDSTDPAEVARGHAEGVFTAVKLYPAHATTHSAHGVTDIDRVMPVLEQMAGLGMPLLIHGEVTDPEVDVFDREAVFIERVLDPLRRRLPELRIVLEHVTTEEATLYVGAGGPNLAATITAHHLVINRNAIFQGGIRPHLYCLPIAKREKHRRACGVPRFRAIPPSFSAPTARRMRSRPRRPPAAAPAFSRPPPLSNSMPRCSRRKARSTVSRPSPR
jgi:dihydroorotase